MNLQKEIDFLKTHALNGNKEALEIMFLAATITAADEYVKGEDQLPVIVKRKTDSFIEVYGSFISRHPNNSQEETIPLPISSDTATNKKFAI